MTSTGARLRSWRELNQLSQAAAAKKIGATQRTWADWEVEKYPPDVDFAEAIERLTGKQIRMVDWAKDRRAKRLASRPRVAAKAVG